jgi:hypothetical protein
VLLFVLLGEVSGLDTDLCQIATKRTASNLFFWRNDDKSGSNLCGASQEEMRQVIEEQRRKPLGAGICSKEGF